MKVTKDTVTISELENWLVPEIRQTAELKNADPNELQFFIENIPASTEGKTKSIKCNFQYFF